MKNLIIILFLTFMLSTFISSFVLLISAMLSKKIKYDHEKMSPFECGFDPILYSRMPFSLKFFLIAILFLVFDVELALLMPLIKSFYLCSINSWMMMSMFLILVLLFGLYFEWIEGMLNWNY